MLTCIILCKDFFQGSGLCKGFVQGSRLMQSPPDPGSRAYRLFQTLSSCSYSLHRLSAILASKDFFTVMASSGHIS